MMFIPNEAAMEALGAQLAQQSTPGTLIYLQGDLGAGKTTLVRGFLRALGHRGAVKSPTYTIVEPYYLSGQHIYHFDLYRLRDPEELEYMGMRDYLQQDNICLIEWPENAKGILPPASIHCTITWKNEAREVQITPHLSNKNDPTILSNPNKPA